MALSAMAVRNAKGRERPYKVSDSRGLYLFVQPSGARYWRLAYRYDGKQRTMALGVYPDVGLADARAKRDAVRQLLASGEDPVAVAIEKKLSARLAAATTFRAVAEEWLEKCERDQLTEVTLYKKRWLLNFAYPKLGNRPVNQISAHEVFLVLRSVEQKGFHETARRLRSACGQVLRYAVATGRADRDVCADLRGALVTPKVKHLAAIVDPKEAGDLLSAIEGFDGYRVTHAALRLSPHLFVRPGELRHAEWSEFDFEQNVWNIPAEKMKMRRPHTVPLSRQALEIIEDIKPVTGKRSYLFPCMGKRDRPMCENTINLAIQRIGFAGRMTAHGFRAMASTLLNETGKWNPDAIERQLGHVDANTVRRIYARGTYWEERVRMMQFWSDYIDELRSAAVERSKAAALKAAA